MNFEQFKTDITEAMTNAGLVEAPAIATYSDSIVDSMPDKSYRLLPKSFSIDNGGATLGHTPRVFSLELGVFFIMRKDYITNEILATCGDVLQALDNLKRDSGFENLEITAGDFEQLPQGLKYKIEMTITY